MGLHHKLCHVLGGTFGLPHSETHTVLLPYVLAFTAPAIPAVISTLRAATGFDAPAAGLRQLALDLGAPPNLWGLGPREGDIARAVGLVDGIRVLESAPGVGERHPRHPAGGHHRPSHLALVDPTQARNGTGSPSHWASVSRSRWGSSTGRPDSVLTSTSVVLAIA